MLRRLMDKIPWRPDKDRLVFLGDFIDRGKNSKGVVDYVLALNRCSTLVSCLMGNHEPVFLDYLNGNDQGRFLANGGLKTVESYLIDKSPNVDDLVPSKHMKFYQSLESYIELENFYVVHAGFRPGIEPEEQTLHDMVWIRDPFIYSDYDFGKKVIFGHTPFKEPLVMENKIGLDTGAVYGNRLTCLELPEMRFHSVGA
jgi:serine/threonine protein phosphatase 1